MACPSGTVVTALGMNVTLIGALNCDCLPKLYVPNIGSKYRPCTIEDVGYW